MGLILPNSYQKPASNALRLGHPLLQGMTGLCVPGEGGGRTINLLSGHQATVVSWKSTWFGRGARKAVWTNEDSRWADPSGQPFTVAVFIQHNVNPNTYHGTVVSRSHWTSSTVNGGWTIYQEYPSQTIWFALRNNNNVACDSYITPIIGNYYWYILRYRSPATAQTGCAVVEYGKPFSWTSTPTFSGGIGATTGTHSLASSGGNSLQTALAYYFWKRDVSDNELKSLLESPYQMFWGDPMELWSAASVPTPTNFTQTLSDGIGLVDVANRTCVFSRTLTESMGTTDALGNASDAIRAFAESFGLSDSLNKGEDKILSDAMRIVDSLIDVWHASRSIADSIGITDLPVKEYVAVRTIADAVGMTDDVTRLWTAVRAIADSLGITDAMSHVYSGVSNYVKTITDSLGMSDSMEPVQLLLRVMSDALGMSDAVVSIFTASRVVSDSIGMSDGLFLARMVAVADTVGITDDFSRLVTYLRTMEDSEGLVDAVARVIHASRTFTESMGMTDTMSHQFGDVVKAAIAFMLLRKRR